MFIFRVVPAASRTCLLISVFAQRPRVWLVRGGCARGRGEFGTACIGLLANDTSRTLKTIRRSLWMDFGWMIEWNEIILPQVIIMSVCLQCCYHKKPCRLYLLFSALCGNASALAFGACSVAQLTDFKPGCYTFQHWFPHVRVNARGIQRWRWSGIGL